MDSVQSVLVTGASGFIGHTLCAFLKDRGCRVRALLRRSADGPWDESVQADLASSELPPGIMHGIDTVFHLAGVAHAMSGDLQDPRIYATVNTRGSKNLGLMATEAGVRRFIYFSSVKAVSDPGERCVDESWQGLPEDLYGLSKRRAEIELRSLCDQSGMSLVILRPSLVYGPGVKGNLERMLAAIDRGRFPPVPDSGNRRTMVQVEDLVRAAWLAATRLDRLNATFIVSDGPGYTTRQLYEWMCKALDRRPSHWTIPEYVLKPAAATGDLVERLTGRPMPLNSSVLQRLLGSACYQSDRIRNQLGWQPAWTFKQALPGMIDRYRNA